MGCWKGMDTRLRLWLPWTVMLLGAVFMYGYYQFWDPEKCGSVVFGCTLNSFALNYSNSNYTSGRRSGPVSVAPGTKDSHRPRPAGGPIYNDTRRIAVCLVGGARMFELTGGTIRKHLLEPYPNTDVFLHSPLDQDTHKFSLLAGTRNLKVVKIFTPTPIKETKITNDVITAWGSPHGMQGLLQYFNLVEGCYGMVKQYEVRHQFKYDWIIRTRVDGYWRGPLPNITGLDPTHYYVAAGSDFRGLNDRFGMGNPHTSRAANARLSLLPLMHKQGLHGLNSESAYKAQLDLSSVPYARIQVPFCIMTLRREAYPPPPYGLLVLSMASQGPMSGTYCRPCDRPANATTSKYIVDQCMRNWDWPGVAGTDVTVCDGSKPWASNWRHIADPLYRIDAHDPAGVPNFDKRSHQQCVRDMQAFRASTDVWNSPPVGEICRHAIHPS